MNAGPRKRTGHDSAASHGEVDEICPGPHGPLPVRVYQPTGVVRGGVVWVHGGAFYSGNLDMPEADEVGRFLAREGFVVVSPDYRLAPVPPGWPFSSDPERRGPARYPIALEEVEATFHWATLQWPDLHGWALGGASAGANLAACAVLRLLDRDGVVPDAMLLAYPTVHLSLPPASAELQHRTAELPAGRRFSPRAVAEMNANYLGDEVTSDPAAFAGGQDLSGLPRSLVVNSDLDDLRASGQAFTAELARAGVDVMQVREPGSFHGHLNDLGSPAASSSLRRMSTWLQAQDPQRPADALDARMSDGIGT